MRRRRLVAAMLVLLPVVGSPCHAADGLATGAAPSNETQQVPVKEHVFHTDGGPGTPTTLEALAESADVILVGRAVAQQPADVEVTFQDGRKDVMVKTRYEFDVVSALKTRNGVTTGQVKVERLGGRRDRGSHIDDYRQEGFPPFTVGEIYLLFLRYVAAKDIYLSATGDANGVFLIRHGELAPLGESPLARSLTGRPLEDVEMALRARRRPRTADARTRRRPRRIGMPPRVVSQTASRTR